MNIVIGVLIFTVGIAFVLRPETIFQTETYVVVGESMLSEKTTSLVRVFGLLCMIVGLGLIVTTFIDPIYL